MVRVVETLNKDQELNQRAIRKEQVELLRNEHELVYCMTLCKDMNVSVLDCVKYYESHVSTVVNVNKSLDDACKLYLERLKQKKVSHSTYCSVQTKINQLNIRFTKKLVSDITRKQVEDFVFKRKKKLAPKSVNNLLGTYSTFFKWCIAEGFTATNPCIKIEKMITSEAKREILTLEETETYLNFCKDNGYYRELACLVLQLFCGFRVEESSKITWGNIKIHGSYDTIMLEAKDAKMKQQRINEIPRNAKKWLKVCFEGLNIDPYNTVSFKKYENQPIIKYSNKKFVKLRSKLKTETNIVVPPNSPRHSFASYHFAGYGDLPKVKTMMGHSESDEMFFRHYRKMVSKRRGLSYFDIRPSK